jgi:hypothetical protein
MDLLVQLIQRIANLNDREAAVLGGEARGLEHITMLDTESTGPVDGCKLTVPTLSSLIGLLGMRYRQPPESETLCAWRRRGEECQLLGAGVCQPALSHPALAPR